MATAEQIGQLTEEIQEAHQAVERVINHALAYEVTVIGEVFFLRRALSQWKRQVDPIGWE
jgi:uncharacterized protein with HEPN domain